MPALLPLALPEALVRSFSVGNGLERIGLSDAGFGLKLTEQGVIPNVPIPESTAPLSKLVATRTRLNEIAGQLQDVFVEVIGSAAYSEKRQTAERRQAQLQAEWDETFRAFNLATEEFSASAHRTRDEMDSRGGNDSGGI